MGEEFYCIIKLVSGEEILSLICVDENDGDPNIVLQNPITIKMIQNQNGIFFKVKPWINLSEDDFYIIKMNSVITMTETKNKNLINMYKNFIENDYSSDMEISEESSKRGEVKLSDKMGYISTVEESRKLLEKIYKDL